jgi:2,4-dienoyl-CoA reductase-like NADH-dependent reductase (Old Yellow Enzyme family)
MIIGDYPKIATFKSAAAFRAHLDELGIAIPVDDDIRQGTDSPLAQGFPVPLGDASRTVFNVANRFAIHPREGWDGTTDGAPSDNTIRRWKRFGESGAKLIWGGEAVAVRPDGRANPNQLVLSGENMGPIAAPREALVHSHREAMGDDSGLLIGLQLTHSGRFARPVDKKRLEPAILYHHPILDRKFGLPDDYPVLTDDDIRGLIDDFVIAAKRAHQCGFHFVDLKHSHGYLGHEFLSAFTRPGPYGGSLENRTRFLRELVAGIRSEAPGLGIGVRLSAFDLVPYQPDPYQSSEGMLGPGIFENYCGAMPYRFAFGVNQDQPTDIDLTETVALFEILRSLDIRFLNLTAGSPYYNPHIQRPALYPPSDGYQPPEDPLVGVARQMEVVRYLKQLFPDFALVGTAYSYLQEFLPHVAQPAIREGWVDFVGLGRLVLSYPELPKDLLSGNSVQTKRLCRTFSDCTTAPRNGLVSGCYPLDPHYKKSPDMAILARIKKG